MPRKPVIQHQKTAPGPPNATAVERPMILPVPSVAASVVAREAKAPRLFGFLALPASVCGETESRRAVGSFLCTNPVHLVKYRWANKRNKSKGPFQRKLFTVCNRLKSEAMWITPCTF